MEEGRGPRVPRSKGPKVPRTKISSKSHSNTSLTLKKVHFVYFGILQELAMILPELWDMALEVTPVQILNNF